MGFDHKQDALQKEETNRRILDAGFSMFSKMSIDKIYRHCNNPSYRKQQQKPNWKEDIIKFNIFHIYLLILICSFYNL